MLMYFFFKFENLLKIGGFFYFLIIEDNKPEEMEIMLKEKGFGVTYLSFKQRVNEKIYILELQKL